MLLMQLGRKVKVSEKALAINAYPIPCLYVTKIMIGEIVFFFFVGDVEPNQGPLKCEYKNMTTFWLCR